MYSAWHWAVSVCTRREDGKMASARTNEEQKVGMEEDMKELRCGARQAWLAAGEREGRQRGRRAGSVLCRRSRTPQHAAVAEAVPVGAVADDTRQHKGGAANLWWAGWATGLRVRRRRPARARKGGPQQLSSGPGSRQGSTHNGDGVGVVVGEVEVPAEPQAAGGEGGRGHTWDAGVQRCWQPLPRVAERPQPGRLPPASFVILVPRPSSSLIPHSSSSLIPYPRPHPHRMFGCCCTISMNSCGLEEWLTQAQLQTQHQARELGAGLVACPGVRCGFERSAPLDGSASGSANGGGSAPATAPVLYVHSLHHSQAAAKDGCVREDHHWAVTCRSGAKDK